MCFWSWANRHLSDGHAPGVTSLWIDALVRTDKFSEMLQKVGWLVRDADGFHIPLFNRWNAQPSKQRLLAQRRKARQRSRGCHAHKGTKAGPEESRVEYTGKTYEVSPPGAGPGSLMNTPPGAGKGRDRISEGTVPAPARREAGLAHYEALAGHGIAPWARLVATHIAVRLRLSPDEARRQKKSLLAITRRFAAQPNRNDVADEIVAWATEIGSDPNVDRPCAVLQARVNARFTKLGGRQRG